jgi:hypothetical protein
MLRAHRRRRVLPGHFPGIFRLREFAWFFIVMCLTWPSLTALAITRYNDMSFFLEAFQRPQQLV